MLRCHLSLGARKTVIDNLDYLLIIYIAFIFYMMVRAFGIRKRNKKEIWIFG